MSPFRSLRGNVHVGTDNPSSNNEYAPPPGPPPSHRSGSNAQTSGETYAPPPGPPPGYTRNSRAEEFAPPPGPPPSHSSSAAKQQDNPPPYHDWTVIPDNSLLPPPPPLPQDYSPTNNASYDSAARAHEWCARNPVYTPSPPSHEIHLLANEGHIQLEQPPPQLKKHISQFRRLSPTTWHVATNRSQQDAIILSSLPLYFACQDNPLLTERAKTIYFEILVRKIRDDNSGIAIGFAAKPYPPWRLPGWHRASIGVHGDDGRRFVNDPWGGRDFVDAFREGEVIGVGMTFQVTEASAAGGRPPSGLARVKTRAFVTRDGRTDDRWGWDIDEERDERDEGVVGLMGEGDLYPAIGVFGGVDFEVRFGGSVGWRG
jgi:hypothetical protein